MREGQQTCTLLQSQGDLALSANLHPGAGELQEPGLALGEGTGPGLAGFWTQPGSKGLGCSLVSPTLFLKA